MIDQTKRFAQLLTKWKRHKITKQDKQELRKLLEKDRQFRESVSDLWGALIDIGLLYFLSKTKLNAK